MATAHQSSAPASGVARAHRALALFFLLGGAVQFVLAGYSAFGGSDWEPHQIWGSILTLISIILLILAAVGRREALQASAILFGLMLLQHVLGGMGEDAPALGALHPLNALLILGTASLAAAGKPFGFGPPRRAAT